MKYLISILLIALLTGCHFRTGNTEKKIGAVDKTCTSLCASATPLSVMQQDTRQEETASAISASLLERTGQIFTW